MVEGVLTVMVGITRLPGTLAWLLRREENAARAREREGVKAQEIEVGCREPPCVGGSPEVGGAACAWVRGEEECISVIKVGLIR